MWKAWISVVIASAFLTAIAPPASADEAAEKMIEDALPLMYHTCKSVVDETGGDEAAITSVVRSLVAVSLYNHELDVSRHASTDVEKTALSDRFIAVVSEQCDLDNEALLAGVIDDAVISALARK